MVLSSGTGDYHCNPAANIVSHLLSQEDHILIIDCIRFTVIIPAIITNILRSQKPLIYGCELHVLAPTKLKMTIDTMIHCPIPVKLDPVNLSLYNKITTPVAPFLNRLLPSVRVSGNTDTGVKDQIIPVLNQTELWP